MTALDGATRAAAPWIEWFGRAGYAAKGIVFVLIGFLSATAAWKGNRGAADQADAFHFVIGQPFGRPLLAAIGVGLLGYAFWKIASAIGDWERKGKEARGTGARLFSGLVGFIYGGVAIEVLRLVMRTSSGPAGSDSKTQHWTARAFDAPMGRWLVGAVGLAIVAYGIQQMIAAWKAKLNERLRLGSMSPEARRRVIAISRFGIAARGLVFIIVGASLLSAAIARAAERAQGTAGAMGSIADQPFGKALLIVVAFGVIAYGIYSFINARYRLIQAG